MARTKRSKNPVLPVTVARETPKQRVYNTLDVRCGDKNPAG